MKINPLNNRQSRKFYQKQTQYFKPLSKDEIDALLEMRRFEERQKEISKVFKELNVLLNKELTKRNLDWLKLSIFFTSQEQKTSPLEVLTNILNKDKKSKISKEEVLNIVERLKNEYEINILG